MTTHILRNYWRCRARVLHAQQTIYTLTWHHWYLRTPNARKKGLRWVHGHYSSPTDKTHALARNMYNLDQKRNFLHLAFLSVARPHDGEWPNRDAHCLYEFNHLSFPFVGFAPGILYHRPQLLYTTIFQWFWLLRHSYKTSLCVNIAQRTSNQPARWRRHQLCSFKKISWQLKIRLASNQCWV